MPTIGTSGLDIPTLSVWTSPRVYLVGTVTQSAAISSAILDLITSSKHSTPFTTNCGLILLWDNGHRADLEDGVRNFGEITLSNDTFPVAFWPLGHFVPANMNSEFLRSSLLIQVRHDCLLFA
jgi:hypothetical protein